MPDLNIYIFVTMLLNTSIIIFFFYKYMKEKEYLQEVYHDFREAVDAEKEDAKKYLEGYFDVIGERTTLRAEIIRDELDRILEKNVAEHKKLNELMRQQQELCSATQEENISLQNELQKYRGMATKRLERLKRTQAKLREKNSDD